MCVLFLGWLVESYDIGLTGSVLPSLSHAYHLGTFGKSAVGIASTVGIVIGIVPAGWMADRFGRKQVMIWGTVLYAVLSFVTGFAPTVGTVIVLRLIAGLAMGAVFPLPYAYGSELCPPHVRGRFAGFADCFLSVGYFLSPLAAALLIPSPADETGWRVMFFLGGIPIVFALLAWRYLPESPRWYESMGRFADCERVLSAIETKVQRETGEPLPAVARTHSGETGAQPTVSVRMLFSRMYLRRSVVLWITFGGIFFIFYVIQVFLPTVVEAKGFTLTSSFVFTSVIVAVSIPGKLLEAWVVERWGRRPVIIVFGIAAAVAALLFGFVHGAVPVLIVGCAMSFFGIGVDPAVKTYTAESYPTVLRARGSAVTEGFGRLLSGIVGPALVPPLLVLGGTTAVYIAVGVVALIAVATVVFFGEETAGRSLEQVNVVEASR
jgi:putative MFS transporter